MSVILEIGVKKESRLRECKAEVVVHDINKYFVSDKSKLNVSSCQGYKTMGGEEKIF